VTVGLVKEISLSDDGKGVIIRARMNRVVEDYLNESAKFWIVHPDVGSNGIYGLDTIVSGSYIELYGVKGRRSKLNYTGLEHPYIDIMRRVNICFYLPPRAIIYLKGEFYTIGCWRLEKLRGLRYLQMGHVYISQSLLRRIM